MCDLRSAHPKPVSFLVRPYQVSGAPGTTRTCDPLIRSQVLYPAELRVLEDVNDVNSKL